jgi:hypothetical protein
MVENGVLSISVLGSLPTKKYSAPIQYIHSPAPSHPQNYLFLLFKNLLLPFILVTDAFLVSRLFSVGW